MPESKRPLKVFLCHAHADRDPVRGLYSRLTQDGVDAWLDKAKLLPGQDWELEIRKAVREADVVVVCLSKQFNQAGFRQKEVRLALDTAMQKPEGEIFIIPARLEECDNLESLRKWHWVDLFEDDGYEMLVRALNVRASRIDVTLSSKIEKSVLEKKFAKSPNDVRANSVEVGGNVSDSVIVMGNGNVINLSAQSAFSRQEKPVNEQSTFHNTSEEIKAHIEYGLYSEAYKKCILLLSQGENSALINLFAGIAYALNKGEKKLRDNDMQIINKHISLAIQDSKVCPTALAVLGCIKYGYHYLNKMYDSSHLTLEFIRKELQTKADPIDKELLKLIVPTEYALGFLGIQ
ncbi:MAG: toll/interleukin-1 receptor domain-containing protein [Anaerolineales bacterium]|nr:toll/interleukin-1 receptor domain-containing protein [Anaerolineales bacterium]